MKIPSASALLLASSLHFLSVPHGFGQGNLNPPPGPPTPTMKTLDQVEARIIVNAVNTPGDASNAYIISAPGSYYLTGNITGTPGLHGISIQANDVTLDLNGFALISGGGGATRGVNIPAVQSGFCVRNGTIRGWGDGGVRAETAVTLAEKLRLADNVGGIGLAVGNGSMVMDCVASGNTTGFSAPDRTQLSNCIATVNTGFGFNCTSYVTMTDCNSSRNSSGIVVGGSCNVTHCTASRNDFFGLITGSGCLVANCTAGTNGYDGITVNSGSTVQNCATQANGSIGISITTSGVHASCYVVGNTCDSNAYGIYSSGNGSRIDGNSVSLNTNTGINITGNNNMCIRNTAHSNTTNFNIGFNPAGPIVNMTGGNTISSTSPWANFFH